MRRLFYLTGLSFLMHKEECSFFPKTLQLGDGEGVSLVRPEKHAIPLYRYTLAWQLDSRHSAGVREAIPNCYVLTKSCAKRSRLTTAKSLQSTKLMMRSPTQPPASQVP